MLQSLNRLLAGVRKTKSLLHLIVKLVQGILGTPSFLCNIWKGDWILISLDCYVLLVVQFLYSREWLLLNNEDISHSKPLYTFRWKAECCPSVVQLNTNHKSKNVEISGALQPIYHSWLQAGVILTLLFAWGDAHRSSLQNADLASWCCPFYTISIALPWGCVSFLLAWHIHPLECMVIRRATTVLCCHFPIN